MTKAKMIPGKGFQYTPKKSIEWADDFNQLLDNFSSRNDLISKLIEDGLAVQNGSRHKGKGIYIALDNFSNEQLLILNSPDGQKILNNLITSMLGVPVQSNTSFVSQQVVSYVQEPEPPNENRTLDKQISKTNAPTAVPVKKVTNNKELPKQERDMSKQTMVPDDDYSEMDALEELMKDAALTDFLK